MLVLVKVAALPMPKSQGTLGLPGAQAEGMEPRGGLAPSPLCLTAGDLGPAAEEARF